MLANRMTDDSSDTTDSLHNQSSEPHVVVACPSCDTKFAVESSLVASYETPKFHCSRCDAVFETTRSHRSRATGQKEAANAQRWILSENSDRSTSNPFSQAKSAHPPLKSSDFTLGEASSQHVVEPRKPFAPLEERAGLSLLGLRPSAGPSLASSLTRQESIARGTQTSAPETDKTVQDQVDPFALFDRPGTHPTTPEAPPVVEAPKPVKREQAETNSKVPLFKEQNNPAQHADDKTPETSRPSRKGLRELSRSITARLSPRNQGLLHLSTPIMILFGFLCALGYAGHIAPETLDAAFKATVPSLLTGKIARLPSSSLHVQEVSIDFEKTQSKEILPVVRGVIYNSGELSTEDVLVEALGFNFRGEVVARAKAPLRSALTREKISDLPLATVKKFQTSLSARNSTIGAGEKVAFSVALLSDSLAREDVSYFSARIFSVGASRR